MGKSRKKNINWEKNQKNQKWVTGCYTQNLNTKFNGYI